MDESASNRTRSSICVRETESFALNSATGGFDSPTISVAAWQPKPGCWGGKWHRKLIANKYDGSARRSPGRPATARELEALVVRMATENRDWGYVRIQGALSNLGHELARSTIANILKRNAIEPAPERVRKTTWKEFLTQHWEQVVAADFFRAGC